MKIFSDFELNKVKIKREEKIDITPDKSMAEKIGFVGFSPELAFAELIDNSIDAKYDEDTEEPLIEGKINIVILIEENKITIKDNGSGIKRPKECLRLSSSHKKSMLGTFGLGLKTASMSLGKALTIITKFIGHEEGCILSFDLDKWYEYEGWELKDVKYFEAEKNDHGTMLIIEKLNTDPKYYNLDKIKNELAFRFGEFIKNGEIEITINGEKCEPQELDFISKPEFERIKTELEIPDADFPKSRREFSFSLGGFEIEGWIDILERWSYSGSRFGFNIYRGKRLLSPFQKIGIRDHPNHSRIFGHIYLPKEFPVAFTKDKMEVGRVWGGRKLIEAINSIAKDYVKLCEKLARKKIVNVKPQTLKKTTEYLEYLQKAIKDSPVVKDILKSSEEKIRAKEKDSDEVGPVDSEKRGPKVRENLKKSEPKGLSVRQPQQNKQKKKSFFLRIGGKNIRISHNFDYLPEEPIRMYEDIYEEKENEFLVITNMAFDSWHLVSGSANEAFYASMNVIIALSEFLHDQKPSVPIREIRDDIWKTFGKLVYQNI